LIYTVAARVAERSFDPVTRKLNLTLKYRSTVCRTVSFQPVATPDHGRSARGRIPESGDAMDFPVSRGFNDLVP
jgi:hypothetical protein